MMYISGGWRRGFFAAAAFLLFGTTMAVPASADTTVAEYLKLEKRGQAHLLGSLLQSLAEDLQANSRDREAQCLVALYSDNSEARVMRPKGMQDFLQSVEIARESGPEKTTVEQIITRQLVQYCGYGRKKK
jgi:hypothetical protein